MSSSSRASSRVHGGQSPTSTKSPPPPHPKLKLTKQSSLNSSFVTLGPGGPGATTSAKARRAATSSSVTTAAAHAQTQSKLSLYPRTDPIRALTGLVKLLTALPTRIGGCAYKLTPAEHTLALHLVDVLDPYVYHGARVLAPPTLPGASLSTTDGQPTTASSTNTQGPGVTLVSLPTEILDTILGHVESKRDLLHAGLICKRLHDVIFPRHFAYRVIRCKVSSISVWNHLIKHRSLARNVRRLEIIDERSPTTTTTNAKANSSTAMIIPPKTLLLVPPTTVSNTDLETSSDELFMHAKHERFLSTALTKMTGLKEFHWACFHSPVSFERVWPTLRMMMVKGRMGLRALRVCDNLIFGPRVKVLGDGTGSGSEKDSERESESDSDGDGDEDRGKGKKQIALVDMESVSFKSTGHAYGAPKQPELTRLAQVLQYCVRLKNLDITYIHPRSTLNTSTQILTSPLRSRPIADDFLSYSRWPSLTTLSLTNVRCTSHDALSTFLSAHHNIEVLHLDVTINGGGGMSALEPGALEKLRELKAPRDIIQVILATPILPSSSSSRNAGDGDALVTRRPIQTLKGFKLTGTRSAADLAFLATLKAAQQGPAGTSSTGIRRIELLGWHDMEDVRRIMAVVPNVAHVDLGRRLGGGGSSAQSNRNGGGGSTAVAATNMMEWAELLSSLPELVSFHGVRFFYEVSSAVNHVAVTSGVLQQSSTSQGYNNTTSNSSPGQAAAAATAPQQHVSMTDRSRMRKNDEIASVLAWKCSKLRTVDHWEENSGKVVCLLRTQTDEAKVRWEVRRLK